MVLEKVFIEGKVLSGRIYPEFFPFTNTDIVLNIGSGYGPQAIAYQGQFKKMVGIDITHNRLRDSLKLREMSKMGDYEPLQGNVEILPFASEQFDKAIAIDIIEHVQNPAQMCQEIARILKPKGQVLITFPTLHDKYVEIFSWIGRKILRRKPKGTFHDSSDIWNPDAHNQEFSVAEWRKLVETSGLSYRESRATTLFPPLHLYGVPRFWFKNNAIHRIDSFLSQKALLKNYGQGLMAIFEKR